MAGANERSAYLNFNAPPPPELSHMQQAALTFELVKELAPRIKSRNMVTVSKPIGLLGDNSSLTTIDTVLSVVSGTGRAYSLDQRIAPSINQVVDVGAFTADAQHAWTAVLTDGYFIPQGDGPDERITDYVKILGFQFKGWLRAVPIRQWVENVKTDNNNNATPWSPHVKCRIMIIESRDALKEDDHTQYAVSATSTSGSHNIMSLDNVLVCPHVEAANVTKEHVHGYKWHNINCKYKPWINDNLYVDPTATIHRKTPFTVLYDKVHSLKASVPNFVNQDGVDGSTVWFDHKNVHDRVDLDFLFKWKSEVQYNSAFIQNQAPRLMMYVFTDEYTGDNGKPLGILERVTVDYAGTETAVTAAAANNGCWSVGVTGLIQGEVFFTDNV